MKKEKLKTILNTITLLILIIIARYLENIFIRVLVVFIASVILDLIYEIFKNNILKENDFFDIIKSIKNETDIKEKQANIITILFLPVIQTISVIVISFFIITPIF